MILSINDLLALTNKEKVFELTRNWTPEIWLEVRLKTQIHGIAPLLYCRYSNNGVLNLLDQSFKEYLSSQYHLNEKRIQKIQKLLNTILYELHINRISVMPLKGSALINKFYTDQAIRPMADIDLLINERDQKQVEQILNSFTYVLKKETPRHSYFLSDTTIMSVTGEHPDNPIAIEVHTKVVCPLGHKEYDITEYLCKDAEQGFLNLMSVMNPSPPMLLLHLFFHAANNQFAGQLRAIQLYDICLISKILKPNDWSLLLEITEMLNCEKLIYAPMAITQNLFAISVPDFFKVAVQAKTPQKLKNLINIYSLDEFIASSELMTLICQSENFNNKNSNKVLSKINLSFLILFIDSIQLDWYGSTKEKLNALLNRLKAPVFRTEKWGYIISYLMTLLFFFIVLITKHTWLQKIRKKCVNRFKVFVFKYERTT